MDLKAFLNLPSTDRDDFAKRCEASKGSLQNIAYGLRQCNPELAVAIQRESGGLVTRWELRPDDWHRIWPELIATEGVPKAPVADVKAT